MDFEMMDEGMKDVDKDTCTLIVTEEEDFYENDMKSRSYK